MSFLSKRLLAKNFTAGASDLIWYNTVGSNSTGTFFSDITYSEYHKRFVAVHSAYSTSGADGPQVLFQTGWEPNKISYSDDGISWTTIDGPSNYNTRYDNAIASDDKGNFVAVGGINQNIEDNGNYDIITYDFLGRPEYLRFKHSTYNIISSNNGITWTERSLGTLGSWSDVAYGNGRFVVISGPTFDTVVFDYPAYIMETKDFVTETLMSYSDDGGINWNTGNFLPPNTCWEKIEFAEGRFVITSIKDSKVAYSEDGINWTTVNLPFYSNTRFSLTHGDGRFVIVSLSDGKTAYSDDGGSTWSLGSTTVPLAGRGGFSNLGSNHFGITYSNGRFIACSRYSGKQIAYSVDGTSTWYQASLPNGSDKNTSIKSAENKIVCLGDGSSSSAYTIIPPPTNWTHAGSAGASYLHTVAYGKGKFVAVGFIDTRPFYSDDGITWNAGPIPPIGYAFGGDLQSITYGNGKFVIVAYDGQGAAYSENGINFTYAGNIPNLAFGNVYHQGGKFFAMPPSVEYHDFMYCSDDAITWTYVTLPSSAQWHTIVYGKGRFMAFASSGVSAYSDDGITWNSMTLPFTVGQRLMKYGEGRFVAISSGYAYYSDDGITWNSNTFPLSGGPIYLGYGEGKFLCAKYNTDQAVYSYDGITWNSTTLPIVSDWRSIAYGEGKFVILAYNSGQVVVSQYLND